MDSLEQKPVKELREIARQLGICYVAEYKKAELIERIRRANSARNTPIPAGKKRIGYFLDGSPILEDIEERK